MHLLIYSIGPDQAVLLRQVEIEPVLFSFKKSFLFWFLFSSQWNQFSFSSIFIFLTAIILVLVQFLFYESF